VDVAVRDHGHRNSVKGEVEPYPTQVVFCNSKTSFALDCTDTFVRRIGHSQGSVTLTFLGALAQFA